MDLKKLTQKYQLIFLLLFFGLFPLGVLPKLLSQLANFPFFINPIEIVVFLFATISTFQFLTPSRLRKNKLFYFAIVLSSTYLVSLIFFPSFFSLRGGAYLVRTLSFLSFGYGVFSLLRENKIERSTIYSSLILVGLVAGLIGAMQYVFVPDLRQLYLLGWDDHYFRLAGGFLDPGFMGIILVLTIILIKSKINYKNRKGLLPVLIFLLVCTFLTFSRASYLALGISFLLTKNNIKYILAFVIVIILVMPLFSKIGGEGVNLLRTKSILLRFENYKESIHLFSYSPLLGVGYNNTCKAKVLFFNISELPKNSCSGLDNSLLFILVTTGLIGLLSFLDIIVYVVLNTTPIVRNSLIAVLIHSLFSNTLFYPLVLGWMAIIIAVNWRVRDGS